MLKRILKLGIVLILLFSFTGCRPEEDDLQRCKTAAQNEIQSYVEAKQETEYSFENWEALLLAAENAKAAVTNAKSESETTEMVEATMRAIDDILPLEDTGLDKELSDKIIQAYFDTKVKPNFAEATIKDVRLERYFGSFDYFVNEYIAGEDKIYSEFLAVQFVDRFNKYDTVLDKVFLYENETVLTWEETCEQNKIFEWATLRILVTTDLDVNTYFRIRELRNAGFYEYYGTYNGAVVILFDVLTLPDVYTETIAGFGFYYGTGNRITVFKDDLFYSMPEAYDLGLLSDDDVAEIHHIYKYGQQT